MIDRFPGNPVAQLLRVIPLTNWDTVSGSSNRSTRQSHPQSGAFLKKIRKKACAHKVNLPAWESRKIFTQRFNTMKTQNLVLLSSMLGMCMLASTSTLAQFSFSIPTAGGSVNTPSPNQVNVSGTVDFDFANSEVKFKVQNDTSFASSITGVWLLKPFDPLVVTLSDVQPVVAEPPQKKQWELSESADTQTFNFVQSELGTGNEEDKYFGADDVSPSSENTIDSPSNPVDYLVFTFDLPQMGLITDPVDQTAFIANYGTKDALLPHLLFRFQELPDNINGGSAKAFGWLNLEISVIPVPEPSQIAALSMAGLAGLLFIRRRIKAKRTAKA